MKTIRHPLVTTALSLMASVGILCGAANETISRSIPQPLVSHPGNIFVVGEEVVVPLARLESGAWRVVDYDGRVVAEISPQSERTNLGKLPVGFYRLNRTDDPKANWVSVGVLAPLRAPTPATSPIALDVAMAWYYPPDNMDAVANLSTLAGINRVRDRLGWEDMEPRKGKFAPPNNYDASALALSRAGLQVLQVNHSSPSWANPNNKRFPLDLRDTFRFHREMAKRWKGQVTAFEPWNEADVPSFGGHTGSEMASLQKAAYLGLKAGNPQVIACMNAFAVNNRAQLEDLQENAAWPYFDTFNLHHYAPLDQYTALYADFRATSAGRPLWVTEFSLPLEWPDDSELEEPTYADLRTQAERVAQAFAVSLHEGSAASFYFLLPYYTDFGILRPDLTPRPAYVALAAVGRLLADAQPLGRLKAANPVVRGYLFHSQPDGVSRNVLVIWSTGPEANVDLPVTPEAIFDHLGRRQPELKLTGTPLFVVLPENTAAQLTLEPPPNRLRPLMGTPSPVVLQSIWPEDEVALGKSAYRISPEGNETLPLYIYNFGSATVRGRLAVRAPKGWKVNPLPEIELAPQARRKLQLEINYPSATVPFTETVRVTGDFGPAGKPVLSVRLTR